MFVSHVALDWVLMQSHYFFMLNTCDCNDSTAKSMAFHVTIVTEMKLGYSPPLLQANGNNTGVVCEST